MKRTIELTNKKLLSKTTKTIPTAVAITMESTTMTRIDVKLKSDAQSGLIVDCHSDKKKNKRISHTRMARISKYRIRRRIIYKNAKITKTQKKN